MHDLIEVRQMKNGKWRLYRISSQALTAWKGSNDKTTTVREERASQDNYLQILNFNTKEEAQQYSKEVLESTAYEVAK